MALAHGLNRLSPKLESGNFLLYFFSLFEKKKKKKGSVGQAMENETFIGMANNQSSNNWFSRN